MLQHEEAEVDKDSVHEDHCLLHYILANTNFFELLGSAPKDSQDQLRILICATVGGRVCAFGDGSVFMCFLFLFLMYMCVGAVAAI